MHRRARGVVEARAGRGTAPRNLMGRSAPTAKRGLGGKCPIWASPFPVGAMAMSYFFGGVFLSGGDSSFATAQHLHGCLLRC